MTFKMIKKTKEEQPLESEIKKKQDVLTKARNKLFNLSEALKSNKNLSEHNQHKKVITKSKTQINLESLCKQPTGKNQIYYNPKYQTKEKRQIALKKQNSIGSYPIRIEVTDENDEVITNKSRSNLCLDKLEAPLDTEALALEKPRKKLSFKLPEIVDTITKNNNKLGIGGFRNRSGSYRNIREIMEKAGAKPPTLIRNASFNGILEREESFDDSELESQAMRVVRTVGQAFEVCHKLSLNNPENEHLDQDEQDTLTQDLLSDRFSDITSDKPKRDIMLEGASDRISLPLDDCSFKDLDTSKNIRTTGQLDILPPPPNNNINIKNNILTSAEMYSSPHSDGLTTGSAESGGSLPPPGSALSTHHELQLMREQLEQQTQQTQAALAQLQLAREQLAAEQSARLEAQARTHQLLIHNRELLDHIAALVGHLQGSEKSGQQPTPPHMTMPQQHSPQGQPDGPSSDMYEYADIGNPAGFNIPGLAENRNSAPFLPTSPLRTAFNPAGNIFNFPYPQTLEAASFENQLLQKLQALNNFSQPNPFNYPYSQSLPYLLQNLYQPPINTTFPLQNPPQKNMFMSRPFMGGRHSEPRQLNPNYFNQSPPSKKEDYHTPQYTLRQQNVGSQSTDTYQQKESDSPIYQKIIPKRETEEKQLKIQKNIERKERESSPNPLYQTIIPKKQNDDSAQSKNYPFKRESSPRPQERTSQLQEKTCNDKSSPHFIKPYSQIGTLTTTDSEGRLRVVVPVLSNSRDDLTDSFSNLRTDDRYKSNLSRTSSDRPNKSGGNHDTLVRHKSK